VVVAVASERVAAGSRYFLNGEAHRLRKKQSSAIIAVDVRRFGHAINKNEVFGTHKGCGAIPMDRQVK
jgi:hypothetical protein